MYKAHVVFLNFIAEDIAGIETWERLSTMFRFNFHTGVERYIPYSSVLWTDISEVKK